MSNGNELKKASIADLPCLKIGQKQCLCEISCEDCIESHVLAEGYRKQSEWISVEERLPERELQELMRMNPLKVFPCLVVIMGDYYNKAYVSKAYYAEEGFISGGSGLITERITHWMPLPEPPEDKR